MQVGDVVGFEVVGDNEGDTDGETVGSGLVGDGVGEALQKPAKSPPSVTSGHGNIWPGQLGTPSQCPKSHDPGGVRGGADM